MKDSPRVVTFSSRNNSEAGGRDVADDPGAGSGVSKGSDSRPSPSRQPESPTRENQKKTPPSRTSSGKFEDPMLVWKSSQSDGALCPSPSTGIPASPTHSAKFSLGPSSSPTSSSKHLSFRAIETLLDAVPCSTPSPHSPAPPLASPIRSQSPTSLRPAPFLGGSIAAGVSNSTYYSNTTASTMSPSTSMFERLKFNGARSSISSVVSEGGMRTSPHSKSLNFSDDIATADRSYAYCFNDPNTPGDATGATSSSGIPFPSVSRISFSRSSGGAADAAAAAAVVAFESERERASSSGGTDPALRNLSKTKSIGGRSMGGRALNINAGWRSGGALTLSTVASGAPEGGLQSQTHEALQQLLATNSMADPGPNKRFSAPGQGLGGPSPPAHGGFTALALAHGFNGPSPSGHGSGGGTMSGSGRRVSRELSTALSLGSGLLSRAMGEDVSDAGEGAGGGSGASGAAAGAPTRTRRFVRAHTDKLEEQLSLGKAADLSYSDTYPEGGNEDDTF